MTNKSSAMKLMMSALAVLTMASACLGQSYWKRTYGGGSGGLKDESANAIIPAGDGNFIVVGHTGLSYFAGGITGVYILKITPNGDTIWTKTYGDKNLREDAYAIVSTPEGNFIVVGQTYSYSTENYNIYIIKINPNGDTLWTKTYRSIFIEGSTIIPTSEGNFIVVVNSESNDIYLLKINSGGDTIWSKTYRAFIGPDETYSIVPTRDGNFIIAGATYLGLTCVYLLKINTNGDTIWTKSYGGAVVSGPILL